jgi:monoterpene epsilon-lactone hydrolase
LDDGSLAAGVDTTFEEWPDMIHVWHLYATTVPEAREGIDRLGAFVRRHCG